MVDETLDFSIFNIAETIGFGEITIIEYIALVELNYVHTNVVRFYTREKLDRCEWAMHFQRFNISFYHAVYRVNLLNVGATWLAKFLMYFADVRVTLEEENKRQRYQTVAILGTICFENDTYPCKFSLLELRDSLTNV